MKKWLKRKIQIWKLKMAHRWVEEYSHTGLSIVMLQNRGKTQYIVHSDGSFNRLGKRGEK